MGTPNSKKFPSMPTTRANAVIVAVERCKERMGVYPERVLADKIYRNRTNLSYCKELGIRLSGPSLGRPKKDQKIDKKQEYTDNCDRVRGRKSFSLRRKESSGSGLFEHALKRPVCV